MIDILFKITLIVAGISQLLLVAVFFIRLPYIYKAKVVFAGIISVVNILLMIMAASTATVLGMNTQNNIYLFANVLLIFDLGFSLIQYHQHKAVPVAILGAIFLIFFVIWCGEFALNIQSNSIQHIDRLRVTGLFIHVIVVAGCWLYLIDLFKTPFISYRKIPFFWIVIGWLFYYTVTSTSLFTGLTDPTHLPTVLLYDWTAFADTVANTLYIIGFWKTKDWVVRHQL